MEALAAVGLAANVLQFVQFGFELLSVSSTIRKSTDALPVGYADLEIIGDNLENHIKSLSTRCDPDLRALVDRAREIAIQLLDTTEKLKKKNVGRMNRWSCFRQALEVILKRNVIEELTSRLGRIREQLQFHLIVGLRNAQTTILSSHEKLINEMKKMKDNASATQSQSASRDSDLSHNLKGLLRSLEEINCGIDSIESRENLFNLGDILRQLQKSVLPLRDIIAQDKTTAILESLEFSNMTVRQTSIFEAHRKTFEWVFKVKDLPEDDPRSQVALVDWLQSGKGIYWITGKPGSGKSTLMKFLDKHRSMSRMLDEWAEKTRLVKASFYFWNAGTRMQKSIEGLLQSLLYTIFSHRPDLVAVLCPDRMTLADRQTKNDWSLTELRAVFDRLVSHQDESTKFYFHIDGLDEYEGNPDEVIKIIKELAEQPTYKVCVSSRPWNQFQKTFGRSAVNCLQLHLFTKEDITRFAREGLQSQGHLPRFKDHDSEDHYSELVSEISQRAQGIFLWVRLVVRSLRDGQFNSDPVSIMRKRLDDIPTDLEEFFQQILQSVDQVYGERMARTFLAALASPKPLKIIHYSFLDEDDPYFGWTTDFEPLSQDQIDMRISETRWRLNGRYKGLLEPASDEKSCHVTVDFLHRTLRDFLLTSSVKSYLDARVSNEFDAMKATVGALLAEANFLCKDFAPQNFAAALDLSATADLLRDNNRNSDCGTSSTECLLRFQVMDHIDAIHRFICLKNLQTLHIPGLVLRAAINYRQLDYVKHRVQNCTLQHELNWILLHLSCYPNGSDHLPNDILGYNMEFLSFHNPRKRNDIHGVRWEWVDPYEAKMKNFKKVSKECLIPYDPAQELKDREKLRFEIILDLVAREASPTAKVENTFIWTHFLETGELQVAGPLHENYWRILQLFVDKGADPADQHMDLWMRMLEQIPSMGYRSLVSIFEGFTFLLERGLPADTNLWLNLLSHIPKSRTVLHLQRLSGPFGLTPPKALIDSPGFNDHPRKLCRDLIEMFLHRGANVASIVDILPGHRFGNISWFEHFRIELKNTTLLILTPPDEPYTLFKIFFENGLDPNHKVQGSTIWELLLDILHPQNSVPSIARLLILFLQHRADPRSKTLHEIIGLKSRFGSIFREPDASDLKRTVERELADLRQRDYLFEQRLRTTRYPRILDTRIRNLLLPDATQRKPLEKRSYL